jgi:hypothetical protein
MLTVNKSVCDLDDVIDSIRASTRIQEEKIAALDQFRQNCENFAAEVVRIDGEVADPVNRNKEIFYSQYEYLRPECERHGWEKICDGFASAAEWCKEHWAMVTTVLVVIGIALLCVVTLGVAVAAIAAIAAIVSLTLCLADVICMIATGGKNIATVCRENGLGWLGEIFQGLSIGCDIVSIVFPAGAAIKSMAKIGVKTFARASIKTMQTAYKETVEKVLKSGFAEGIENFGKLAFKTFVLDVDDLRNWKAVKLGIPNANKHWRIDGDALTPNAKTIPHGHNPDGLSMEGIMHKFGADSIPFKNGSPDFSGITVADAKISMKNLKPKVVNDYLNGNMTEKQFDKALRNMNFANADADLPKGVTFKLLQEQAGFNITRHEELDMKKVLYVPREIHANVSHVGGVGNFKFEFNRIPGLSKLVGEKTVQFGFRFGAEEGVAVAYGKGEA